jgi:flagellar basal body-associated protein FliL
MEMNGMADKKKGSDSQLNLTIIALVALVAIVGLVALVMNAAGTKTAGLATGSRAVQAQTVFVDDARGNVAGQVSASCQQMIDYWVGVATDPDAPPRIQRMAASIALELQADC